MVFFLILDMEPVASSMLEKCSNTDLTSALYKTLDPVGIYFGI